MQPSCGNARSNPRGATRVHVVSSLAWLVLAGCGHSPPPAPAVKPPAPVPVAVAAIDWLPSASFALLQIDADQVRSQLPLEQLAARLSPEQHTLLERTHTVILAFDVVGGEPAMAGVFVGDYDARINPLLLADKQRVRTDDPARELWRAGEDVWLRTPEGHWVAGEAGLADALLTPPAARAKRLSSQPWTAAPSEPYFASAALHVTPPLQTALRKQAERESFAAMIAQFGPALLELRDVRMTALPDGDGLRLRSSLDFQSELGAQGGALVLRGLLALMGAAVPQDAEPQAAADSALLMEAIDGAQIGVVGTQVRADIALDGPQLAALGRLLKDREQGAAIASDAPPAYQPPSAEQLAERQRAIRADRTFGKVLDAVLERAGADVELREGRHPQTGKTGTSFLTVRVAPANGPALREQLRAALLDEGMQVVPIARGFEGQPTELGIFRARDEPAVLIARGTGEARAKGASKQLAAQLRKWQVHTPLEIAVAADDYFALDLTAVPPEPDLVVRELIALCPQANAAEQRRQLVEQQRLDCFLQ